MTRRLAQLILMTSLLALTGCGLSPQRNKLPTQTATDLSSPIPTRVNDFGMEFIHVPAGTFNMGSPTDEIGRDQDERLHEVTIRQDFYLQRTEVTQGQWRAVMGHNPSYFLNCGDQCPVEQVTWVDAQRFIAKLNQLDPVHEYRLPSEAEWEYAARAGAATALPNGNLRGETGNALFSDESLDEVGWYVGNSLQGTHPVGQKQPNAWGFFDMHGNVQEWVDDWHNSYPFNSVVDPPGPELGSTKIRRGGSWNLYTRFCRSASRSWLSPTVFDPFTGLRLIAAIKPVTPATASAPSETVTPVPAATAWEIFFELDSDIITEMMSSRLTDIISIVANSDKMLVLEGHTCDLASEEYNQKLSERRAASVKRFFLEHAIPEKRIKSLALGERYPGYPNDSIEGRQRNRRVLVHLE